ncbi:glycosyltransferase family 4 protein [Rhodovastum atsumiense]|uniref:Glycosyltransferase family 4 protein n=2 Tax=Rhodovastum atsumiense TaxID=504468 RepID=A0A5M6J2E1_9PROT|nr:glycosyltransferase family 4 protein [Rhodovastum atsumiense]
MSMRVWLDVEDLLQYGRSGVRPSGIQRLAFELYRALGEVDGNGQQIRFLRHDSTGQGFVTVPWSDLVRLFDRITATKPGVQDAAPTPTPVPARASLAWRVARGAASCLPVPVRQSLGRAVYLQRQAVRELSGAARGVLGALLRHRRRPDRGDEAGTMTGMKLEELARPGDVLAVMGSPWFCAGHDAMLRSAREDLGLRVVVMIYDIIPLRRPEWCDAVLAATFRRWFHAVVPLADVVFTISRASAEDIRAYAQGTGLKLAGPVVAVPIGTGFGAPPAVPATLDRSRLPEPGSYALFVSTIEARKNHALLFRVWRNLLESLPPGEVPTLVFAGRIGWMVADLLQQIRNSGHLDGKLLIIESPSDAELQALYEGCRFTLFPSLYEGWGLPVTESLAFGKPCLVAATTSLPEAGGKLARYFDPENVADATRMIRSAIIDKDGLRAWEAQVRQEFRPVPWTETAYAVLAAMALERAAA